MAGRLSPALPPLCFACGVHPGAQCLPFTPCKVAIRAVRVIRPPHAQCWVCSGEPRRQTDAGYILPPGPLSCGCAGPTAQGIATAPRAHRSPAVTSFLVSPWRVRHTAPRCVRGPRSPAYMHPCEPCTLSPFLPMNMDMDMDVDMGMVRTCGRRLGGSMSI